MSLKKTYISFWLVVFAAFFTPTHAFAITETTQLISVLKKQETDEKRDKWANASFLTGLLNPIAMLVLTGLTGSALVLLAGVPLAIFGIIWGAKALKRIKREPTRKGKDVAITGIILNCLFFVGLVFLFYILLTSGD